MSTATDIANAIIQRAIATGQPVREEYPDDVWMIVFWTLRVLGRDDLLPIDAPTEIATAPPHANERPRHA